MCGLDGRTAGVDRWWAIPRVCWDEMPSSSLLSFSFHLDGAKVRSGLVWLGLGGLHLHAWLGLCIGFEGIMGFSFAAAAAG